MSEDKPRLDTNEQVQFDVPLDVPDHHASALPTYDEAMARIHELEGSKSSHEQLNRLVDRISLEMSSPGPLDSLLQAFCQAFVDELNVAFARIWLLDPAGNMLVLKSSAGIYTHLNGKHSHVPVGILKIGRIAEERKPHLTNVVTTDSWVSDPEWASREGMVCFAGYPLEIADKLLGVVAMFGRSEFSETVFDGLAAISRLISSEVSRRQTEAQLQATAQHARTLLEFSADAIAVVSPDGHIADLNQAAVKLFGMTKEQSLGKHINEFVTDPEGNTRAFRETLLTGGIQNFVFRLVQPMGTFVECCLNANVYHNADGTIAGVIASLRDVTAQKHYEQQLRTLASIIEHTIDAVFTRSPSGLITSWNKGAEAIYGFTANEMLDSTIYKIVPEDRVEELEELTRKVLSGELVDHLETRRKRKDGQIIHVSLSLSPVFDDKGEIVAISTISRDITEKKLLERKLECNETLFRNICSGAMDAIVCMDDEGKITIWNTAAERIFGYSADQAIGQNLHNLITPSRFHEKFARGFAQFRESGRGPVLGKTIEIDALRSDGEEFPIELSISALRIEERWHAVGIIRDITERKNSESQLKEKEQLLLQERETITVANERLNQQTTELKQFAEHMELLTQFSEFLQICATNEEVHNIVGQFGSQLFPHSDGALYIFQESRNWLEQVAFWGDPQIGCTGFPLNDCWSIRKGQPHLYSVTKPGPRCLHVDSQTECCLCVPLVLLGEVFGVMFVQWQKERSDPDEEKLVARLTSDTALALANLRLRKQLKDLSIRDSLTGLYNRRYMEEFFGQELMRARRSAKTFSVIMIDIDHFKNFNDKFGHEAGDAVLHELGQFFLSEMRGSDVVCRYGGEEFIMLLPESNLSDTLRRAEQLREKVKQMRVRFLNNGLPEINLSLGVSCFPEHGQNREDLIRAADDALYRAKSEGRDRVCCASEMRK